MTKSLEFELPLRIVVVQPPTDVQFCLQAKANELIDETHSTGDDIAFDLSVRVAEGKPPRFLGPFTQGPPSQRFVYICSGTCAGQHGSCWTRRAKIQLSGITQELIDQVRARPGSRLEARFHGTAKDGGPSCATVPLLDGGWQWRNFA